MPKFDFNYPKIENHTVPTLESTISLLESSCSSCCFDAAEFSGKVAAAREQLQQVKNNVESLLQWLESSMNIVKSTSEVLKNDAKNLPICEIRLRESPINFK